MISAWMPDHLGNICTDASNRVALVTRADVGPVLPGLYMWDMWPVQNRDGTIASFGGREYWMVLTAPDRGDPALRHFETKIRLMSRHDNEWHDLGNVLDEADIPYEREWAGSCVFYNGMLRLYYTGAGLRAQPGGYQQEIYLSCATISSGGEISPWSEPRHLLSGGDASYRAADEQTGEPGKITAFRDPAYFHDPATGRQYLIFTASWAGASSPFDGAVGIASIGPDGRYSLLPPLMQAGGVNKELERAHVVSHGGKYYLFWSTQASTFAAGLEAPTGLYGMVADSLLGPYVPLNGSGLIAANPPSEPFQTYSWFVTAELRVSSFVDHWGLAGRNVRDDPQLAASSFGGVPAPLFALDLQGDRASVKNCGHAGVR